MKPNLLAAALFTALILACFAAPAAAFSGAGSGTEADPYIVTTPAQLQEMNNDLDAYYKLGNDIDLSSLGTSTSDTSLIGSASAPFKGSLDGNGHTISNIYRVIWYVDYWTLNNIKFENIDVEITSSDFINTNGFVIFNPTPTNTLYYENVGFENIDVKLTSSYAGARVILFGYDNINVKNCYVLGGSLSAIKNNAYGEAVTSGLGVMNTNIENCYVFLDSASAINNNQGNALTLGLLLGNRGQSSTISNTVVLTPHYTHGSSYNANTFGRLYSYFNGVPNIVTVSNSYAYSPTVINSNSITTGSTNDMNGGSVTQSEMYSENWWVNNLAQWDWENTWYWDETENLPKLQIFSAIPPTISSISATPATGGQQTEYTLSVTATTEAEGGIASYQWSYSTDSGNTWLPISGATAATYVWTPGTSISGTVLLKCYITGADGGTVDSYEAGYANIQITVYPPPDISTISVSRPLQKVNTPTTLTATLAESEPATYQWYYSTNGGQTWTPISGATALTAEYTPTTTGTHSVKIVVTNSFGESNELTTNFNVLPTYTPTPITNTSVDISIDSTAKYQGMQQFTLSAELKALNYYTPNLAHLAHDNALYYLDSAERKVIPVSTTTGGTISAAYVGQYTGIITDTSGNTAFYSYQTNDWQYIEQYSAAIIASTSSYAATVSGGTLRIYNLNGNLIASTATTAANLAGNDQTNVFVSYSGATITYYWYQNGEIKTASKTLGHTITELHQISSTANWIVSTTANTYTISISDTGSYELLSTTDTDTPLIHTQATNINVLIGVSAPNEIFIVGADGETDGTYVTGSTLSDASIAKATGLYAIAGGEDRQAYILAKSTSSTWQLLQTVNFGDNIDYSQISTTGTYTAVSTGLKLYLLEAVDISANSYLLQGVIIGSSGSVWANKPFTINGDNLRTDAAGRFVYSVQPATLYTIVTDTTTTEYTATNAALQTIAIKLKPNPFAQSVSYSTDYNADTRNFEMTYTDTRDMTSSVTWVIRETGNQTIVSTQTVQAGQTAYWEVPLDKSFTSYQISMIADRQGTNVENTWIITPDGKNPINIPGLDETGKTILFGAVLMIFGGLFGVMHSTKGALLTVLLAGVFAYLGLLNIPTTVIMVAATLAVAALLAKGSGGS